MGVEGSIYRIGIIYVVQYAYFVFTKYDEIY